MKSPILHIVVLIYSFYFSGLAQTAITLPSYTEHLIRYEIIQKYAPLLQGECFDHRTEIEHRFLNSFTYQINQTKYYNIVLGSGFGEGYSCNACGSLISVFTYSLNEDNFAIVNYKLCLVESGNAGAYPLRVEFLDMKNGEVIIQLNSLLFSPGGVVNEYSKFINLFSNGHSDIYNLFSISDEDKFTNHKKLEIIKSPCDSQYCEYFIGTQSALTPEIKFQHQEGIYHKFVLKEGKYIPDQSN